MAQRSWKQQRISSFSINLQTTIVLHLFIFLRMELSVCFSCLLCVCLYVCLSVGISLSLIGCTYAYSSSYNHVLYYIVSTFNIVSVDKPQQLQSMQDNISNVSKKLQLKEENMSIYLLPCVLVHVRASVSTSAYPSICMSVCVYQSFFVF